MNNDDVKKSFTELIQRSDLDESSKSLWINLISQGKEENLQEIFQILKEDMSLLTILTDNLQQKMQVIGKEDFKEQWDKILDEEEKILESI